MKGVRFSGSTVIIILYGSRINTDGLHWLTPLGLELVLIAPRDSGDARESQGTSGRESSENDVIWWGLTKLVQEELDEIHERTQSKIHIVQI